MPLVNHKLKTKRDSGLQNNTSYRKAFLNRKLFPLNGTAYLCNCGHGGQNYYEGNYLVHTAKGNLLRGALFKEWTNIWNSSLQRTFTAGFEVYGEKAQDRKTQQWIFL